MKKNIIILGTAIIVLSLMTYSFVSNNDARADRVEFSTSDLVALDEQDVVGPSEDVFPDFFFAVGTRFNSIKKGDLDKAKSFDDFIGKEHAQRIVSYKSLTVIILDDDKQTDIREAGKSRLLTSEQKNFLKSADHSTNILIRADYIEKNEETDKLEDSYWTPYLTVVPEKQAKYRTGNDAFLKYLKENSKERTSIVQKDKLQPGKLYFTVTKDGTTSDAKITVSSGYPSIDEAMIELITSAPATWEPAENSKGEKVDQTLVLSFGRIGC